MGGGVNKRGGGLLLMAVVILSAISLTIPAIMAAGEMTAIRDISNQTVEAGNTFTVTVIVIANQDVNAPALDEDLPSGWTVTEVESAGATFKSISAEWLWLSSFSAGASKKVIYEVAVPSDATNGDHTITGHVDAYDVAEISVGGASTVTVIGGSAPTPTSSPTQTLDPRSPFASPNSRPNTPSVPEGSSSGYVSTTYAYTTAATDPDGDKLTYRLDWGDGWFSDWSLSASSGSSVSRSHFWSRAGTYYVRAQVEDTDGKTSNWSSPITVNISQSTAHTSTAMATSTLTATPTSKDTDGDGMSDIDELLAGTDPQYKSDYPSEASAQTIAPAPTPASTPTATATATPAPELTSVTASTPVPPTPTPEEEEPGFEAVLAIASLLAIAYLVLEKREC